MFCSYTFRAVKKQAKIITEDGKVSLRNIRREAVDKIKLAEKDKQVDKDSSKFYQVTAVVKNACPVI